MNLRERRELDRLIFLHGLTAIQARMAYVLLEVNGFENAREFVEKDDPLWQDFKRKQTIEVEVQR